MAKNNEVAVVQRGNTLPAVQSEIRERFVTPSTDILETPDAYVLMIDLPGASKDAIKVMIGNGTLSVSARVEALSGEKMTLLYNELRARTYYRLFNLGDGVDRTNIDARYENGVLTIKLFRKDETKVKEITIK